MDRGTTSAPARASPTVEDRIAATSAAPVQSISTPEAPPLLRARTAASRQLERAAMALPRPRLASVLIVVFACEVGMVAAWLSYPWIGQVLEALTAAPR